MEEFQYDKLIRDDGSFSIWNVHDKENNQYVLKTASKENINVKSSVELRREYDIQLLMSTKSERFLKPERYIEEINFTGILWKRKTKLLYLDDYIKNTQTIIQESFLQIAKKIAKGFHELHSEGIMHKNIQSQNFMIDPKTLAIYIIGLEKATYWKEVIIYKCNENEEIKLSPKLYQYISPEQTGKTRNPIDFRSDLYSMGIVFYEMLSGKAPFTAISNETALLFAHISVEIPPLHCLKDLQNFVSPVIGDIIDKLLKKDINRRYQSAFGLLKDLESCNAYLDVKLKSLKRRGSLNLLLNEKQTGKDKKVDQEEIQRRSSFAVVEEDFYDQIEKIKAIHKNQLSNIDGDDDKTCVMKLGEKDSRSFLSAPSKMYGIVDNIGEIYKNYLSCKSNKHSFTTLIEGLSGSGKTTL